MDEHTIVGEHGFFEELNQQKDPRPKQESHEHGEGEERRYLSYGCQDVYRSTNRRLESLM